MITAYLNETIIIRRASALDTRNERTFTDESVPAYVEWFNKLVVDKTGNEVVSCGMVYLAGTITAPSTDDEITIDSTRHSIIRIDRKKHFSKTHYEVWIK